ncbi:MAG: hypothetical protein IKA99_00285 [Clostridia bacterium]|nr:hypothetical protein [Clostridia bacterium]
MEKFKEILQINWVHQLIGLGFFALGIIVGAIVVLVLWKNFAQRDKKQNKTPKDVFYLTQNAISAFDNGNTDLQIEKISYVCEALVYLLDKIPQEYGNTKVYEVLKKEAFKINGKEVLLSNLNMHLDFTVYELLRFINGISEKMRAEVYSILNSKLGKTAWGIGKFIFKNDIQEKDRNKSLDDITVGAIVNTVISICNKIKEKPESKINGFFKPFAKTAQNLAFGVANSQIDYYVKDIIEIFANELNKLYSGQLKSLSVKDISMSSLEEGV